jgi:hypothetical protein
LAGVVEEDVLSFLSMSLLVCFFFITMLYLGGFKIDDANRLGNEAASASVGFFGFHTFVGLRVGD